MDNNKDDFYYVKRILKSVEVLTRYLKDKSIDDLLYDGFLQDAIENRFTKIAEDSAKISADFKKSTPQIPWTSITSIRNKVCHNYDIVDAPTLYKAIKVDFIDFKNNLLSNFVYHRMNLCSGPFDLIEQKSKTIEMRLFDEKRQKIKIGDIIIFVNLDTKKEIITEVMDLKVYKTFEELYANYPKRSLGYHADEIANPNDMLEYYSKEDISNFGVLAIEIKLY
ncbi:MAG: DUF86 domain-containing protein [Bacilli bacterium]|nr:DUF86 domain-containing protein [Bacilli bacterium]